MMKMTTYILPEILDALKLWKVGTISFFLCIVCMTSLITLAMVMKDIIYRERDYQ